MPSKLYFAHRPRRKLRECGCQVVTVLSDASVLCWNIQRQTLQVSVWRVLLVAKHAPQLYIRALSLQKIQEEIIKLPGFFGAQKYMNKIIWA